eukprot:gnl/Spiro4/12616_TR6671_c0_g1_i1.p1 gnl/Spiro4/12616_TR6671_c0_g1~~gnl/Spiro4/12616_TR6671_c0_g1_i1.p1  ORF type:complete len:277 (+),score=80.64 gnl/Spiro4/12616_TR6671_c0_g1_i1:29-832(+)
MRTQCRQPTNKPSFFPSHRAPFLFLFFLSFLAITPTHAQIKKPVIEDLPPLPDYSANSLENIYKPLFDPPTTQEQEPKKPVVLNVTCCCGSQHVISATPIWHHIRDLVSNTSLAVADVIPTAFAAGLKLTAARINVTFSHAGVFHEKCSAHCSHAVDRGFFLGVDAVHVDDESPSAAFDEEVWCTRNTTFMTAVLRARYQNEWKDWFSPSDPHYTAKTRLLVARPAEASAARRQTTDNNTQRAKPARSYEQAPSSTSGVSTPAQDEL